MSFIFFLLPIEVRTIVYRLLLVNTDVVFKLQDGTVALNAPKRVPKYVDIRAFQRFTPAKNLHTEILRSCIQIYEEATPMLWGENYFALEDSIDGPTMFWYLHELGDINKIQHIRYLEIIWWGHRFSKDHIRHAITLLQDNGCNLHTFILSIPENYFLTPSLQVDKFLQMLGDLRTEYKLEIRNYNCLLPDIDVEMEAAMHSLGDAKDWGVSLEITDYTPDLPYFEKRWTLEPTEVVQYTWEKEDRKRKSKKRRVQLAD
ncbi:uncharacterized protein KY384_008633 [Bacidia gigantensis]|uniref:uncharacterized protein n=1 Tax=Bacidia gigantensis TaxID=2732470 RepID=UPI001D036FEE|nr:uncharacterized protein KY384_008633 [Bacidia gigantensis]KAG8527203.1 hypothetical protein KY384_008633 [Bacidia gigantensis]